MKGLGVGHALKAGKIPIFLKPIMADTHEFGIGVPEMTDDHDWWHGGDLCLTKIIINETYDKI